MKFVEMMYMTDWRLLKLETNNAFTNMSIDEAILLARISGEVPNTIRFFRWQPSSVSIGRFQKISNEINLEVCQKHGVDLVRRVSGGGSVYHDYYGEITYSVIVKKRDLKTFDIFDIYRIICNGLIEAIKILGVHADFDPGDFKHCPNVLVNGKKISGSSQFHKRGVLLQHGTFLLDVDLAKMFMFLKVPWADSCLEVVSIAEDKVTSVKHELGSEVSMYHAYMALVKGLESALKINLIEGELTEREMEIAERLRKEKYSTDSWNLGGKL